MALPALAVLAATGLLVPACSGAPPLSRPLADVNQTQLFCPIKIGFAMFDDRVPSMIKEISCDQEAIREKNIRGCEEVHDDVLIFDRHGGNSTEHIRIGCFHNPEHSQSADQMDGH